jgi:hypothetical protein
LYERLENPNPSRTITQPPAWRCLPSLPHSRYQSVATLIDQHTIMLHSGEIDDATKRGTSIKRNHVVTSPINVHQLCTMSKPMERAQGGHMIRPNWPNEQYGHIWQVHSRNAVDSSPAENDEDSDWVMVPTPGSKKPPAPSAIPCALPWSSGGVFATTLYTYSPATGTLLSHWYPLSPVLHVLFLSPVSLAHTLAMCLGRYCFGGNGEKSSGVYDSQRSTWRQLCDMPEKRAYGAAVHYPPTNEIIVMVCSLPASPPLHNILVFDASICFMTLIISNAISWNNE